MKKKFFVVTPFLAAFMASMSAHAAPQTGAINISGSVIDSPCYVDVGSSNVSVTLPNVDKTMLQLPDSSAGVTPFTLKVSGCSEGGGVQKVSVAFIPDSNVDMNGNLANTGTAQNIAVQILDKDQNPIDIRNDTFSAQMARGAATDSADIDLRYFAKYHSVAGNAGAGDVSAVANFQLVYN